jgi:hypothetical protein
MQASHFQSYVGTAHHVVRYGPRDECVFDGDGGYSSRRRRIFSRIRFWAAMRYGVQTWELS